MVTSCLLSRVALGCSMRSVSLLLKRKLQQRVPVCAMSFITCTTRVKFYVESTLGCVKNACRLLQANKLLGGGVTGLLIPLYWVWSVDVAYSLLQMVIIMKVLYASKVTYHGGRKCSSIHSV